MARNSTFCCAGCGSRGASIARTYNPTELFKNILPDGYIYKCGACGLCQVDHTAVDQKNLAALYKDSYRLSKPLDPGQVHNKFTVRAWIFRDLIRRYFKGTPRAIFEPGCGFGHSLMYFRRYFPDCRVYTHELDVNSLGAGIDVFDPFRDRGKMFDVILMSHLLEHIVHPREYIRRMIDLLAPGGLLIIEVPNDNMHFLSRKWIVEPHVTFFDKISLTRFFEHFDAQLQIKECFTAKGTDILEPLLEPAAAIRYHIKNVLRGVLKSNPVTRTMLSTYQRGRKPPEVHPEPVDFSLMKRRYRLFAPPAHENAGWGLRMVLQKRTQ